MLLYYRIKNENNKNGYPLKHWGVLVGCTGWVSRPCLLMNMDWS